MEEGWRFAAMSSVPVTAAVVLEVCQPRHSGLVSLSQLKQQNKVNKYISTNTRPPFPDSYYLAVNKEPIIERPPVTSDQVADVCVIGGGLAGLTTALGLVERGKRVVLLESKRVGWNASGRNGGFAIPGISVEPDELVVDLGKKGARTYFQSTVSALRLLRSRISQYDIQCDVQDAGSLVLSTHPHDAEATSSAVEGINQVLGTPYEFWTAEKCAALYRSTRYSFGVFDPTSFIVQPLGLCHGLARAAESHGAVIYEDSPARKISRASDGARGRWVVTTGSSEQQAHSILCQHVVLAGNCHLDPSLDFMVARSVLPMYTYIGVTEPLGDRLAEAISQDAPFSVCDDIVCLNYFRPLPDGRLLWGGFAQMYEIPNDRLEAEIKALITKNFPQLGSDFKLDYMWGGDIGCGASDYPLVGVREPGYYYATAFGGHGVVPTTMTGEMIAHAIASGDDSAIEEYQRKHPLEYVGWPLDRVIAQVFFWYYQFCDFTGASVSRVQDLIQEQRKK